MMRERPIIMGADSIMAILGGRKTQTRRVIKPQPIHMPEGACIDDIPVEHMFKAKNGKRYVNLLVSEMRQPDDKGNTHTVSVDTWKPDESRSVKNAPENFVDDFPF